MLNKILYAEAPPSGLAPFRPIDHFSQKRYLFHVPFIDKWYPKSPGQKIFLTFHSHKIRLLALLGPSTDRNDIQKNGCQGD